MKTKKLIVIKLILMLVLIINFNYFVNAQFCTTTYQVGTSNGATSSCPQNSALLISKYGLYNTFVPQIGSSVIKLKVVLHMIRPTWTSWTNVFDPTSSNPALQHQSLINQLSDPNNATSIFGGKTDRFSNPRIDTYNLSGFVASSLSDSKTEYEITNVYYYKDDQLWNTINGETDPQKLDRIAAYIDNTYPGRLDEGLPVISTPIGPRCGTYNNRPIIGCHIGSTVNNTGGPLQKMTLRHELGHAFGMNHNYDSQSLNCADPNYLWDVIPLNNGSNCSSYNCTDPSGYNAASTCQNCYERCQHGTNNIMSDNLINGPTSDNTWISPLQMGMRRMNMHLNLGWRGNIREFAKEMQSSYWGRMIIYNNETWDFDIQMYEDIEVKAGATLTIKCKVAMATDGRIIVNKGAKLIIDGGEVTGWCKKTPSVSYNNIPLWMGIQVIGTPNVVQSINSAGYCSIAGIVEVKNTGKVSYAQNGIFGSFCSNGQLNPNNSSGGIVISNGGIFENNIRDILLFYQTGVTGSKIVNSTFITNGLIGNDGNNNKIKPTEHIKLYQNAGIIFKGNTFEYSAGNTYLAQDRGIGIYSTDSQFSTDKSIVNGVTYRNKFKNLTQGIYIDNFNPLYAVSITNCDFDYQTLRSFTSENQNNLLFMDNNITNTQIYLYKTKYYTIKNNNFYGNSQLPGIVVHQSGTGAHQIYKNNFTNWNVAILAQENNGSLLQTGNGLKMNCNDFTFSSIRNVYDIALTKAIEPMPLVMAQQSPFNSPGQSALETVRNIYGANFNPSIPAKSKWFVDASSTQNIIHNYPITVPATNPNNPNPQASNQIGLYGKNVTFNYSQHCLTFPASSGNNTSPSNGSSRLVNMNNYITELRSSNNNSDNDFEIQATVSSKLNYFLNDTTVGNSDSVVAILNNNQGNMDDADIQVIFAYLKKKDFANATTKINNLPNSRSDWRELLLKVEEVEQDTLGGLCLLTNTTLANYFAAYANVEGKDGQVVAQALMRFAFGVEHDYPIILPPNLDQGTRHDNNLLETAINSVIEENYSVKIYPNPTQKGINILYSGNEEGNLKLEIKDLLGRLIYANFIVKKEIMYLPLIDLLNGVYIVSIQKADKKIIYQSKLIKQD